jgi:hypothetical protein
MNEKQTNALCSHCKEKKVKDFGYNCEGCAKLISEGKTIRPICSDCKKNVVLPWKYYYHSSVNEEDKYKRCGPCFEKQMTRWKNQQKRLALEPYTKTCENCKKIFSPSHHNDRYCHSPCKSMKSVLTEAEKWLNVKKRLPPKRDSDSVAYAFFRKKYSPRNIICRG